MDVLRQQFTQLLTPSASTRGHDGTLPPASAGAHTRLSGRALVIVRSAWLILSGLSLVLLAMDVRLYAAVLQTTCVRAICPSTQLTPAGARVVAHLGWSLPVYGRVVIIDTLLVIAIFYAVAVFLAWRRSDDWLALLVAYMLLATGTATVTSSLPVPNATWSFLNNLELFLGYAPALFLVFYLFPDGSFTPRWLGWAIGLVVVVEATNTFMPGSPLDVNHWIPSIEDFFFFGLFAALALAQVYRYRNVYTPVQRQQTKFVIFSVAVFAACGLTLYTLGPIVFPATSQGAILLSVIAPLLFVNVFALLFPVSFAIAILRYRLWDIDLLINRTLVYGSLTTVLALLYFLTVLIVQDIAVGLTGQHRTQPVAIVVSTLVVAALFAPLRRRLQALIDRRFYRSRYDAARTVAAFAATLRHEWELNELSEQLLSVVQETTQPAHLSLWLRPVESHDITGEG